MRRTTQKLSVDEVLKFFDEKWHLYASSSHNRARKSLDYSCAAECMTYRVVHNGTTMWVGGNLSDAIRNYNEIYC